MSVKVNIHYERPPRDFLSAYTMTNVIGIPRKFVEKSLNDFETPSEELKDIKSFVSEYMNNIHSNFKNCKGIYFFGNNGAGKTMLSSLILKKAYGNRYSCKRITFQEYVQLVLNVWSAKGEEKDAREENLFTNIKGVEFLVLEELGKEIQTSLDTNAILEDLLRYREDKGYPTIFAANISIEKVREMYGASIHSLIEGNSVVIELSTFDGRKKFRRRD